MNDNIYAKLRQEQNKEAIANANNFINDTLEINESKRIEAETKKVMDIINQEHPTWSFSEVLKEGSKYRSLIKNGMSAEEAYNSINNKKDPFQEEIEKLYIKIATENKGLTKEQISEIIKSEPLEMIKEGRTADEIYDYLKQNNILSDYIISHYY